MNNTPESLILASSSPYRQQLLRRLGLPFSAISPDIDESAMPLESPRELVQRLAVGKATAVASLPAISSASSHSIIGSDQVCVLTHGSTQTILGKPHTERNAINQLLQCSGKTVHFLTSYCLLQTNQGSVHIAEQGVHTTKVVFRDLDKDEVERYVAAEQPLDCAGSFKCEGLGISLFQELESTDPTGLIGLPLISICHALRTAGLHIP